MQSKITFKRVSGLVGKTLAALCLLCFMTSTIYAQTYTNGVLSSGTVAANGTVAPTGFSWSEAGNVTGNTTVANASAGFSASITGSATLADDFTVPAGPAWNVTKVTVYAYSTGVTGTTSPFNDLRIRIHAADPSTGTAPIVFGDLTTNRLTSSSSANVYRIFNTVVPPSPTATNRIIWKLEASVNANLNPGTYWLEYQTGTSLTSNFVPPSSPFGVRTVAGYNAKQSIAGDWITLTDNGIDPDFNDAGQPVAVDFPFQLEYSTVPCAGTPAPGNTIASVSASCPGVAINFSLQNATSGTGVTYQWQSSPDSATWTNIAGATNSTYTTTQTAATYYRALVTCTGVTTASTGKQVTLQTTAGCYCIAGSSETTFEKIANVKVGTLNNPSTSTAGYEDFTAVAAPKLDAGGVYPLVVTGNADAYENDVVNVWIDFNQDGDFTDAGEAVFASDLGAGPYMTNLNIPANALLGKTRMRVRIFDAFFGNGTEGPCGLNTYGQVEDYLVEITPCSPVVITTQPANVTAGCSSNANITVVTTGTNVTYQWQSRANATSPWVNLTNGPVYNGVTSSTLTIVNVSAANSGTQYRVITNGACSGTDFSSVATLTVTPLVTLVNATPSAICGGAGTIVPIKITNPAVTTSVTFSSTGGPTAIPDASATGTSLPIAVSGIPAGAVITGISATFNITHTYVGDIVVNLKKPTATGTTGILNLVTFLDNAGGTNSTDNFANTTVSSTGTLPMSGAPAPRTGTYMADAYLVTGGPTGGVSNVTDWSTLLTGNPNGNWTLYAADATGGDEGTLDSWSITITYGAPVLGIFTSTPATPNTMFTDALATVPYTGTPVNQIYVNPTVTTNYSVVASTPNCTAAAVTVPVSVNNRPGGISTVANQSACVGSTATFTVSATTGNGFTYRWQSSPDGITFTNIVGATTGTLTLTNVTATQNNFRYRAILEVAACSTADTSNVATLTVNPTPIVVISTSSSSLLPGQTATLTAAVSPNAGASYIWYKNNVVVAGAVTNTLTGISVDALGEYSVRATDVNGCSALSKSSVAITAASSTSLFIYPVPNNGKFHVRYYDKPGATYSRFPRTISVYDSKGSKVFTKKYTILGAYTDMSVDISLNGKGVYTVDLLDYNGDRLKTGRVVVL